ncbi:MAG: HEAT repeat domain-containing protein [Nocardioides sp.]
MTVRTIAYVAALVMVLACLVTVILLVLIRVLRDRSEQRRRTVRAPVWREVMQLSTGEGEEVDLAQRRLASASATERAAVLGDAFALVPKLRGDARERLRDVLRSRGSMDQALALAHSRSHVRRCRGLYRLGILCDPAGRGSVLDALNDRDFAVRRSAMLAGAAFPDEETTSLLLQAAARDPQLRREFLGSVDRIGTPAIGVLTRALTETDRETEHETDAEHDRAGYLAAAALGLVGAVQAIPALEAALLRGSDVRRVACIYALGELGAASSVGVLSEAVQQGSPNVRIAAAHGLGLIGSDAAVPALAECLSAEDVEVARAAANALKRCGATGRDLLRESEAPVAREVVALATLGSG